MALVAEFLVLVFALAAVVDGLECLSGTYLRTHTLQDGPSCLKGSATRSIVPRTYSNVMLGGV